MSPFRELRKSDFQQTTTYQKPLELRTATQRQQQLISYFCDLQLHSDKLDACWGSRAHASTTVQKYSARTFSLRDKSRGVKSHIFAPLLLLLPSLLQKPLPFPWSLLKQEAKYVYEGCTSKNCENVMHIQDLRKILEQCLSLPHSTMNSVGTWALFSLDGVGTLLSLHFLPEAAVTWLFVLPTSFCWSMKFWHCRCDKNKNI